MTFKSGLRPALTLLTCLTLAFSACGVLDEEDHQGIGSDDSGIGVVMNVGTDGETGTDDSIAAPTTSIPTVDAEPEPQVEPIADQRDQATDEVDRDFCEASADYWVASASASFIDVERPGEVSMLYQLMETRLNRAISLAPSPELAEPALVAREHFTIVYAAVEEARFDLDVVQSGQQYEDIEPSLRTLIEIDDLLETYLVGPCDYALSSLEGGVLSLADDIARLVDDVLVDSDTGDDSIDGDYSGDYIEIVDSADRLKVEVPIDWEDTLSEPTANGSALTIGPDVSAYFTTWRADGIKMTVTDATRPIDWRAPMYETNASSDCTLIDSTPYSDSLYTGWIDRYDNCAGGPASAVVIGATDEDFSVEILIEVQFDDIDTQNDEATLAQVLDTFQAR
jgi:hypothetical protein